MQKAPAREPPINKKKREDNRNFGGATSLDRNAREDEQVGQDFDARRLIAEARR